MKSNKNILIVGGTGFIGYHLAEHVINNGWNVSSIIVFYLETIRFQDIRVIRNGIICYWNIGFVCVLFQIRLKSGEIVR